MKTPKVNPRTRFNVNNSTEGETIEEKLRKITAEKEPIGQVFPKIYTDRKDGVLPGYNIRSDRFEIARIAKEKIGTAEAQKWAKAQEKQEAENAKETATQAEN